MRKILSALFTFVILNNAFAQTTITGALKDTAENRYPQNTVVMLLSPGDSLIQAFTRTKSDGSFQLQNVKQGKYILIASHPAYADFFEEIEVPSESVFKLPNIAVTPKSKLLEAIILQSTGTIRIKGDTTIFNADSFKVAANANVEELLKKLPGLQVDNAGNITAMGQSVRKVLVDGEEFFGDDPGMAVKNLRADAVKEVQVFDKKSEQSEFTGIDDGNTQKTINLKLKENKKVGYFGKIDLAGGPPPKDIKDPRYGANFMLGSFKGKRKLNGFLLSGNNGKEGMTWEEEQKYAGESDNMSIEMNDDGGVMISVMSGGTSDGEAYINPRNGFLTNLNAGLQYSNAYGEKHKINFSPRYNKQDYENNESSYSSTLFAGTELNTRSDNFTHINRDNQKFRGIYEYKLDSFSTIKINGSANFYNSNTERSTDRETRGGDGILKNSSLSEESNSYNKEALAANIDYRRRFRKERRTLTITGNWNTLQNNGLGFLNSDNQDYFNKITQLVDQQFNTERNTTNLRSSFTYTEPLTSKWAVQLGYAVNANTGSNSQVTYSKDQQSGKYQSVVDSLTNEFEQKIIQQTPSFRFNYSTKKVKLNLGAGAAVTNFLLQDLTFKKDYDRDYLNYFPSANLNYTYKPQHNLRLNYNGNTSQPTIDQLQPLRNNNNLFNEILGNPNLRPSFRNTISLGHNSFVMLKELFTYAELSYSTTSNAITNSRLVDLGSGKTISQPINTDGNYNFNFYGGIGSKIKKLDLRYGFNGYLGYNKYAEIYNNEKAFANVLYGGLNNNLSKAKEDKYDINWRNNIGYNSNKIALNNSTINYWSYSSDINGVIYYKKVWSITPSYSLQTRQKTGQQEGYTINMVNMTLQRTFKNKEFTAYVYVNDLLNQNRSVESNFYGNTFTERRYDRLKRYFMAGFRWDFKNKSSTPK